MEDFTTEAYFDAFWEEQPTEVCEDTQAKDVAMKAWNEAAKMAQETHASLLIDVWCREHGGQIPWDKCIQITAIVCKMPDEERDRLLAMK